MLGIVSQWPAAKRKRNNAREIGDNLNAKQPMDSADTRVSFVLFME